jgi:hypothetical protein
MMRAGIGGVLTSLLIVLLLVLTTTQSPGCGAGVWQPGPITSQTQADCIGQSPATIAGIVNGFQHGGESWISPVLAALPCAAAIARDLLIRPDVPPAVKERATTALALDSYQTIKNYQGTTMQGAPGTQMQGGQGEQMIRGFGRDPKPTPTR